MRLPTTSRRIVVDTNVARSASESVHPISDACRRVLDAMLTGQHRIVLSATQFREWQKHQSPYARRWLASMKAKNLWHVLTPEPDSGLTNGIHKLIAQKKPAPKCSRTCICWKARWLPTTPWCRRKPTC